MTKQKSVQMKVQMKVQMNYEKCRKKALQIAAGTYGVLSVSLDGTDKEVIMVVVGISMDSLCLVRRLRKKVGHTELVSVTMGKRDDKKKDEKIKMRKRFLAPVTTVLHSSICSIM